MATATATTRTRATITAIVSTERAVETILYKRIARGEKFSYTEDGRCGDGLARLLRNSGWRYYSTGSACKVASFETNLERHGVHVSIVESDLFGAFTQIQVR